MDRYAFTKFQILLGQVPLDGIRRMLNVGCGSGEANLWLAQKGYVVAAIDPAQEAIFLSEGIKERYKLQRLSLIQVGIEEFSPDVFYDAVLSLNVLEHVSDDAAVIRRLHSLLKPGGTVLITVPAMPSLFGHHDKMLGHYRWYTKQELSQKVAPWFDIVYLRYFGFFLVPVAFLFSRLLKRAYPIQRSHEVTLLNKGLQLLFAIERKMAFPTGTSLLLVGRKIHTDRQLTEFAKNTSPGKAVAGFSATSAQKSSS